MAHLKAFRQRWLAAAAQPDAPIPAPAPVPQPPLASPRPQAAALLPKKRLLESCGTGASPPDSTVAAKKQRQVAAAQPQQPQQPPPTKPKLDGVSRLNSEGRPRPEAKASSKPAAPSAAAAAAAVAAAKPAKREGVMGAGEAGKASRAAKKEQAERPARKEAAERAPKPAGARPVKKEPAGERPAKKEGASSKAAGDKPARPRVPAEANGRSAKLAAAKQAAQAPEPAVKQEQQEHAGSNPSSMHREGGHAAGTEPRHQQQATSPARPRPSGTADRTGAEVGASSVGTPVDVLLSPAEAARHVGELVVAAYSGHSELWEAVRARFADRLPSGRPRLLYQDSDGDWLLLQPEAPWHLFSATVRKLVVAAPPTPQPKAEAGKE